jgi:sugar (pentulose or hexulose) kinase
VTLVGGLADQSAALQLRADILGTRIRTLENREASTVGAAMVAGVAGGVFADLDQAAEAMVRYDRTVDPIAGRAEVYASAYESWSRFFYPKMVEMTGTHRRHRIHNLPGEHRD